MTNAHTPGPWRFDHDSKIIMDAFHEIFIATVHPSTIGDPVGTDLANARLIAAAPELLEALRECADQLYLSIFASATADKAYALIAKSTGAPATA